ncbi:MAG: nitroreductase family protein [Anaerolineae bacterium]|nr:nitroreductase family protein [Anaerolineae bacterium]
MTYKQAVTDLIKKRFSCRNYRPQPVAAGEQEQLRQFLSTLQTGPLGSSARIELIAATEDDAKALKGLGTYGFIKNPRGFIAGAMPDGEKNLEDLGYMLESAVLFATDLGLGTCWLGGSFAKSNFARRIALRPDETLPVVIALGYDAGEKRRIDAFIRQSAGSDHRLDWEKLFFAGKFGAPLARDDAGDYAVPLEMVRLGPSASNKQPWRIVKDGNRWHFYLQRTPGYSKPLLGLVHIPDLQRLDIGIAMSHFALTSGELGLNGKWVNAQPNISLPDALTEYVVSWQEG